MEELLTLKDLLLKGDISGALAVVEELEEISQDDIINNIRSYAVILWVRKDASAAHAQLWGATYNGKVFFSLQATRTR